MKTLTKIIISVAILGTLFLIIGLATVNFDIRKLSANFDDDAEYTEIKKSEEYDATKIKIDVYNNKIKFLKSDDANFNISYFESEKNSVEYSVEDGLISITAREPRRKWFFSLFSWGITKPSVITVAVPKSFSGIIDIKTINGSVSVLSLESIQSLRLKTSNGTLTAKDMTINGDVSMTSSNRDIITANLVCDEITMNTSNGKVSTTKLTANRIDGTTSNGSIYYKNVISEKIYATSSNGSIEMLISGIYADYEIDVSTSLGSIKIEGSKVSSSVINSGADKKAKAKTSNGSISIKFA